MNRNRSYRKIMAGICILLLNIGMLAGCTGDSGDNIEGISETEPVHAFLDEFTTVSDADAASYFVIDTSRPYEVDLPEYSPQVMVSYSKDYAVIPYTGAVSSDATTKICIDHTDNTVIDNENPFEKIYPASVTKIMTALLVLENGDLDDVFTLEAPIDLGDPMAVSLGLQVGDRITVRELLNGLLLESANDYAVALGRYVAGNDQGFVKMMNQRAAELGATHTHFMNPHGLHDEEHYTTGYDLYLIYRELIAYKEYREIAGQTTHDLVLTDQEGNQIHKTIENSNQYIAGNVTAPEGITVLCGKTGTTSEAGCCLILLVVDQSGKEYIVVVCGVSNHSYLYTLMNEELSKIE